MNTSPSNNPNNQNNAGTNAGYAVLGATLTGATAAAAYGIHKAIANQPAKAVAKPSDASSDTIAKSASSAERTAKLNEIAKWRREVEANLDFDHLPQFIPENASPTRADRRAAEARDNFAALPKYVPPEFHGRV